jgi:hypothetical protein
MKKVVREHCRWMKDVMVSDLAFHVVRSPPRESLASTQEKSESWEGEEGTCFSSISAAELRFLNAGYI